VFWAVQTAAWLACFLALFIGVLPYVGSSPHLSSIQAVFFQKLALACAGFVYTSALGWIYQRPLRPLIPWAIALSYIGGVTISAASNGTVLWPAIFSGAVHNAILVLAWSACYFGFVYYRRGEQQMKDARQARMEMLRYQLHPHFLFNSLNSIQALIRENPERAHEVVDRLAAFLRYTLSSPETGDVALADEFAVMEDYLAIERIRFEEKLSTTLDASPEARDFRIPAFLLHPLVENAVKYGMRTSAMPLQVRVRASVDRGGLKICVANTGRWISREEGGIGLANVRKRLEHRFPGKHRIDLMERDGWVESMIEIAS